MAANKHHHGMLTTGQPLQQQQLASRALLTLRPIPALPVSPSREEERSDGRHAAAALLRAHPDWPQVPDAAWIAGSVALGLAFLAWLAAFLRHFGRREPVEIGRAHV